VFFDEKKALGLLKEGVERRGERESDWMYVYVDLTMNGLK